MEKVLKILNSVEGQKILEISKNFLKSSNNNFSLDNSLVRLQTETQNARLENVESETSQDEIEAQNDVEICENNSEEIFAKPQSVPKKVPKISKVKRTRGNRHLKPNLSTIMETTETESMKSLNDSQMSQVVNNTLNQAMITTGEITRTESCLSLMSEGSNHTLNRAMITSTISGTSINETQNESENSPTQSSSSEIGQNSGKSTRKFDLKTHEENRDKKFKCDFKDKEFKCDFKTDVKVILKRHLESHENRNKKLENTQRLNVKNVLKC